MNQLVQGLDELSSRISGQNGHMQEAWGETDLRDGLTKLFFQLVRTTNNPEGLARIVEKYTELVDKAVRVQSDQGINYLLSLLFQTRDIVGGKGEYTLFYYMLPVWDEHWPIIKDKMVRPLSFLFDARASLPVVLDNPYGSWKDIKYIFNQYKTLYSWNNSQAKTAWKSYGVLVFLVNLAVDQLVVHIKESAAPTTLLAKWLPREKSALFGWQAPIFATALYEKLYGLKQTSQCTMLMNYRQAIAGINQTLHTVQINQCAGTWSQINFDKNITSITLNRQKKAFMCEGKKSFDLEDSPQDMSTLHDTTDRMQCKVNYTTYIDECSKGVKTIKAARVSPGDLVKEYYLKNTDSTRAQIDLTWDQILVNSTTKLENVVVMLDTSGSMTSGNCPLYDAIAIAIQIASKSIVGKRIMTFSDKPEWVNFDGLTSLSSIVGKLSKCPWGMTTNIYAAFELLLDACIKTNLSPEKVGELSLVILSDMQINAADKDWTNNTTLQEQIVRLFHAGGLKSIHNTPYPTPLLVFWNMASTKGFPCATTTKKTVMMSGYNADILSDILKDGMSSIIERTPIQHITTLLKAPRYSWFW